MAWHTLQDALKMTGRSRSQFYRDMRAGLVSYRTSQDGRREFETSELIRAYGELKQDETPERHSAGQAENPHDQQTERILRDRSKDLTPKKSRLLADTISAVYLDGYEGRQ